MKNNSIPVLMYHSVGFVDNNWIWSHLTCPIKVFENQIIQLKKHGFYTCNMSELNDHYKGLIKLPKKTVALTFDDGYLDNYVYAYPIMKKYGLKGTVFINPEFVEKKQILREIYTENDKNIKKDIHGYLSWNEIIKMEQEGVIFAESHAMTHTWYPKNNNIIDYRHPGDQYIWMTWNNNIEQKPLLQCDNKQLVIYGQPVYEHGKSLGTIKNNVDVLLDKYMIEFVKKNGDDKFFLKRDWKDILDKEVLEYKKNNIIASKYESKSDYEQRVFDELISSKKILEEKLNREVLCLCWPGGSATKEGMKIARNIGYQLFTIGNDMSKKEKIKYGNVVGSPGRIKRYTPIQYKVVIKGKEYLVYSKGKYYILQILLNMYYGNTQYVLKIFDRIYRGLNSYAVRRNLHYLAE